MANCREKIKRTKTFTGCLTCRTRKVKCGEEKPSCLRCRNASLKCDGYSTVLTWPGCKKSRRQQIAVHDSSLKRPVYTMSQMTVSFAITALDFLPLGKCWTIGLFGVFPMSTEVATRIDFHPVTSCSTPEEYVYSGKSVEIIGKGNELNFAGSSHFDSELTWMETRPFKPQGYYTQSTLARHHTPTLLTKSYIPDSPRCSFLPLTSREERQLMDYWIHYLSPLMIPVQCQENPFQTMLLPLALSAVSRTSDVHGAGVSTLRNSLYALAAVSQENRSPGVHNGMLSAKYLQRSFQDLRLSLSKTDTDIPEAVLMAIVLLLIVGIFNEHATSWRVHLKGAFTWLNSIKRSALRKNCNASTIYDIFICLEALRPAHHALALDLQPHNGYLDDETRDEHEILENERQLRHDSTSFPLQNPFGITRPILEVILQINKWVYRAYQPPTSELQMLELKLIMNDPEKTQLSKETVEERMMWLNGCLFHVATYIYFSRSIQKLPLQDVQHLVQRSVDNLDEIAVLEQGKNVSGLLWPAFITACEANQKHLRDRIDAYFDAREALSVGNVANARTVVREVWRRRDMMRGSVDVTWPEVMADLGINILLS